MFPNPLRSSKSDRCLRKLKKSCPNLAWSPKRRKDMSVSQEQLDFHPDVPLLDTPLPLETPLLPPMSPRPPRRSRCLSTRKARRDTILLDLSNNDLLPALDYAFAILDADKDSSQLVADPTSPVSSGQESFSSPSTPHIPSSPTCSSASVGTSMRSTPPRYVCVSSPLSSSEPSPFPSPRHLSKERRVRTRDSYRQVTFDPIELSRALTYAELGRTPERESPSLDLPAASVPFPPPPVPHSARTPLLQRKPRMIHSAEASMDGHDSFSYRSCPGSSHVSLARSLSSVDHRHDYFTSRVCQSTASVNTFDSGLTSLFAWHPSPKRAFSSPKRSRVLLSRRASTPPPSHTRSRSPLFGILSVRPPVSPASPDVFTCPPAIRKANDPPFLPVPRSVTGP